MFSTGDARLFWATRGERRIQWNSLIDDERRIALLRLYGFMFSQLAPALYKDATKAPDPFVPAEWVILRVPCEPRYSAFCRNQSAFRRFKPDVFRYDP